ncbi:MAG: ABC transporter ATP-binding protein [Candidatus Dormibacteria bacterium]
MPREHDNREPSAGDAAIEVRSLCKTYPGGVEAVRDISFDVEPGEVFGLLGPNGAGKSTTIGVLTTTVRSTSGTARVAGYDVATRPLDARAVSSVVFQDQVLDAALTGRRHLDIHARLWGVARAVAAARIDDVAATLGAADILDRPVGTYSGGQRRRLEIARALVSLPRVLFLDEPTVGLDPRIRHQLIDTIAALRARDGMTILLTTHYLDEAERLCDRVAIVHEGRIVALDTPSTLLGELGNEVVEVRVAADGDSALAVLRARRLAGDDAFAVGGTVTIPMRNGDAPQTVADIRELGIGTTAISARPPSLDDVYLRLTGARIAAAA